MLWQRQSLGSRAQRASKSDEGASIVAGALSRDERVFIVDKGGTGSVGIVQGDWCSSAEKFISFEVPTVGVAARTKSIAANARQSTTREVIVVRERRGSWRVRWLHM